MDREAIRDQFSYRGDAGAIWRGFDTVLDTDGYLNLGYSTGRQSHAIGAPQRRLIDHVARHLATRGIGDGDRLLDIGCGRGGPAEQLTNQLGIDYIGIDLVPYNINHARTTVTGPSTTFLLGNATNLPFTDARIDSAIAIDSIVYIESPQAVFDELHRVLVPGGQLVITDLFVQEASPRQSAVLRRFTERWGFPPLRDRSTYRGHIEAAGLVIHDEEDLTPNSVGRFRRWTARYRRLRRFPTGGILTNMARRFDLDLDAIDRQVAAAHAALPHLQHGLFVLERPP